jgi:hypothetical protein
VGGVGVDCLTVKLRYVSNGVVNGGILVSLIVNFCSDNIG